MRLWKTATPGIACVGSSGQTKAISGEPGVRRIRDRFQERPARGRQQPAKTDCIICATKDLHSLNKTTVRKNTMDLSHQLLHRYPVLVRVEAGGGDVLGYKPLRPTV